MNPKAINTKSLLSLAGSIVVCIVAIIISIKLNKPAINEVSLFWYENLFKPVFSPPIWLYKAGWTGTYLFIFAALYFVLNSESMDQKAFLNKLENIGLTFEPFAGKAKKRFALIMLGILIIANALWFPIFFGMESITGGLFVVSFLLVSLFTAFYKTYKVFIPAALFLIPYFLWTSYILGLNLSFLFINLAAI